MRRNLPEPAVASSATERARRASGVAEDAVGALPAAEVPARPTRRRYTAEYKQSIVKAADALREPGQIGALLRREGIYSSLLSKWRAQRDRGALDALTPRKRGRKPALHTPEQARIAALERDNRTLRAELQQAKLIIDVQKKLPICWGAVLPTTTANATLERCAAPG